MQPVKIDEQRRVALTPVNPHGRHPFAEMLFPAKFRASLRLLVNIPEPLRKSPYELFVRQMYGKEEVGRVTWRLSPAINRLKRNVQ